MAVQGPGLFYEPPKVRIELWGPTGDIDGRNIALCQRPDAQLSRLACHLFPTLRPRIDVAMPTGLVAQLPHIDLQDRDASGMQRCQASLGHGGCEWRTGGGHRQAVSLLLT